MSVLIEARAMAVGRGAGQERDPEKWIPVFQKG